MSHLTNILHLWPETNVENNGMVTASVTIEHSAPQSRQQLWYRLPLEHNK